MTQILSAACWLPRTIASKCIGLDGRLTFMSEGGMRVMEISDFNAVRGCPWPDFWQDEGNEEARAAIAAAVEGRSSRFTGFANTFIGTPKWWDVQVSPILGADGKPTAILSVSRDITALKRSEERNQLLAMELGHRVKNTLAMVQAIIAQTLKPNVPFEAARQSLLSRIAALGKAHDMLGPSSAPTAPLRAIVESTLASIDNTERVTLSGPPLDLSAGQAFGLALAINELAVNATKYGALSNEAGRVAIDWTRSDDGAFRFNWTESGGPAVTTPERRGFGSSLLQRAVAGYFDGSGELSFPPAGVVFTLNGRVAAAA